MPVYERVSDHSTILVVIPAFDAAKMIGAVLQQVFTVVSPEQVIVVDDGSSDGTASHVSSAGAGLLQHPENRGKGHALRTAFEFVKARSSAEAIIVLDADGQHLPEEMTRFISSFERTRADLIVGKRSFKRPQMPLARIWSNSITSFLLSRKLGCKILDSQCGYRLYSRKLLESIEFKTGGYETETEIIIKAVRNGLRVEFVPITTVYDGQKSHIRGLRDTLRFVRLYLAS